MDNVTLSFINEAKTIIRTIQISLETIKTSPVFLKTEVHTLFRETHKLKGNSAFLNFTYLEKLCHKMEDVFAAIKDGVNLNIKNLTNMVFETTSVLENTINKISIGDTDYIDNIDLYVEGLTGLLPKGYGLDKDAIIPPIGKILKDTGKVSEEKVNEALKVQRKNFGDILKDMGAVAQKDIDLAIKEQDKIKGALKVTDNLRSHNTQKYAFSSVIIDKEDISALYNITEKLSQCIDGISSKSDTKILKRDLQGIHKDLSLLTNKVKSTPISKIIHKFFKPSQELAIRFNKRINFVINGEDVQIDINKVEGLSESLIHLLRNSIDHGIGTPLDRQKVGKNEIGTIELSFSETKDNTIITLKDDGRGLNKPKIEATARKMGILNTNSKKINDDLICALICMPGFSTLEKATPISGRGYGLDIVKSTVERMHGKFEIKNLGPNGVEFKMVLPK